MHGLTGISIRELLASQKLLLSVDDSFGDCCFWSVALDSRQSMPSGLFFCKGAHFKSEYLTEARGNGAIGYLAEQRMDDTLPCVLVSDVPRAMALVPALFTITRSAE